MVRDHRLAENERLIRESNWEIEQDSRPFSGQEALRRDDVELELFCACGRPDCEEKLFLTVREYEGAHAQPHRFVIARGHANEAIEQVVEEHGHWQVVEKLPEFQGADPTAGG